MTVEATPQRVAHCRGCHQRVWWAYRGDVGGRMTLNPAPVPADRVGAMVLIGTNAYTRAAGVVRLAEMFACTEERADELARNTYTWHLPHLATCTHRESA
jgi:hypothetical protein